MDGAQIAPGTPGPTEAYLELGEQGPAAYDNAGRRRVITLIVRAFIAFEALLGLVNLSRGATRVGLMNFAFAGALIALGLYLRRGKHKR